MDGTARIDHNHLAFDPVAAAQEIQALVLIVSDNPDLAHSLEMVCDFLGLGVEILTSEQAIAPHLRVPRPMAIITEVDGRDQDGFHVMMEVARHDQDLPIMLLTGTDPAVLGAADAVREMTRLTSVTLAPQTPTVGELVDFLFRAGRRSGWGRLIPN